MSSKRDVAERFEMPQVTTGWPTIQSCTLIDVMPMEGVDEFDTVFDPQSEVDGNAVIESCTTGITSPEQLAKTGGVLMASTAGINCVSDYDKIWPLLLHPEAVPWGVGSRPTGEKGQVIMGETNE